MDKVFFLVSKQMLMLLLGIWMDSVSYNGDRGIHTVQVSENVNVSTSLDGESVFGRVETTQTVAKAFLKL